jgi:glycerol-3-phosphate acyltransferase PlsY
MWTALTLLNGILAFAVGYLLGSIPFGLLLTKVAGTEDIRNIGSRNIGATNVLRTGRKGLAAATLLLDVLKGTAAVLLVQNLLWLDMALIAGFGAFIGHLFPVWLRFKGGKGVATYIGILIGVAWPVAIIFCVVWLLIALVTRYSSASSLTASAISPVALWWIGQPRAALLFVVLSILVFIMHRANIARLLAGTETRIGDKASAQ